MSRATRIRRGFRVGAESDNYKIQLSIFLCFNVPSIKITLLGKVLSDFHQVHALLTTIDLIDERLQVTSAEHCDDDVLSMESEMTRTGCVQ